ncbi:MAG: aminotransferase class I/II-fold pyridoxal phosphate-dependent enzyme, partial [Candidatus Dormibacteraeota bacterium]|nr:aminotransferase class I/II-fold pyridoxal phosphate-dependent enzyme [Candidatus Dormibacteraeota bacterium]
AGEISSSVEDAIRTGELKPLDALPPVRRLAQDLSVSPTTVQAAYRDLQRRGLVTASGRRGTQVSLRPPLASRSVAEVPPGVRDLSSGNPDPAFLPALPDFLQRLRGRQWLYGESPYVADLLQLAADSFRADGIEPNFLAVAGGGLDGIERTLMAHLHPGARVGVEDPGFHSLFDLIHALGFVPEPMAVDDSGLRPDHLEASLRQLSAVVVTPRAQNPTGAALDARRAAGLREVLAARPGVLVIEDDHFGAASGADSHTVTSGQEHWAVVRSTSKALGPDLRVAVVAGDAVTISRLEGRQRLGAGWVSRLLQGLVAEMSRDPGVQRLVEAAAGEYGQRREALISALAEQRISARGRSGLNVWAEVPDESEALARLLRGGWAASAGERFRLRSGPGIRISIGAMQAGEAQEIAAALASQTVPAPRTRSG